MRSHRLGRNHVEHRLDEPTPLLGFRIPRRRQPVDVLTQTLGMLRPYRLPMGRLLVEVRVRSAAPLPRLVLWCLVAHVFSMLHKGHPNWQALKGVKPIKGETLILFTYVIPEGDTVNRFNATVVVTVMVNVVGITVNTPSQ